MRELANLKRYVLTGAPGSGKTVIIRQLEVDGFSVVEEAATALIALKQAPGLDEPGPGIPSLTRLPICNEYGCCRVHTGRVKFSFMIDPFSARRPCLTISAVQDPASSHGNWSAL